MRAIWKGAVSFGLVSVPVKVYAATGTNDVRFHQVHEADGGRIRYKRVCSVDGEEVSYPEIAKAYETADGEQVVLSDADLDELPLSTSREIDVVEFVPREQVDPVLFNKAYYLEPEKTALKPYTLLRQALAETDRVAVVKVALRQRESLALLRVRDDVICLQTLLWPDEVREASFDVLSSEVELRPQEKAMAASLVESLAADFDQSAFTDGYAAAVADFVEAKISSGDVRRAPTAEDEGGDGEGAQVVDLLSALQRSVARAKEGRGEGGSTRGAPEGDGEGDAGDDAGAQEGAPAGGRRRSASSRAGTPAKAPAKKAPATKAPAKKAPATKAPATKAPATKAPATKAPAKGRAGSASKGGGEGAADDEKPVRRTRRKSA